MFRFLRSWEEVPIGKVVANIPDLAVGKVVLSDEPEKVNPLLDVVGGLQQVALLK